MNLLADLMAAGFTEYEAKVYLALLSENPATGYQLSKKAGIPRSMVYEALGRLSARGAVLKTEEHRATLFKPIPPNVLLDRFEQEQNNLIQNLRENLSKLYDARDEDHLWSISGRNSIISYAIQMVQGAQTEIMIVMGDTDLSVLSDEVIESYTQGVKVSILLTGEESLPANLDDISNQGITMQIARHPPMESKLQELNHMLLVAVDNRECLIADTESEIGTMTATITNNPKLVLIARQFVWMELFTQRIYEQIGVDLLARLNPEDQRIFENLPSLPS